SERSETLQSELASFRGQVEAELRQREATLDNLLGEYERNLRLAQEERSRLQEEMATRQAELEARFRAQESALEEDRARALEELDRLQQQQEKEQLIRDQFLSFYSTTRDHLAGLRFPEALAALQEFRSYLDQPSVSGLPGIRRRRPVELFLIDSLERLIAQEQRSAQTDTASLIASADLIVRVSDMVGRADRPFQDGDYEQARELYLSALAEIPAVQLGYERLQAIEASLARRRQEQVASLIAAAGSAYRQEDYQSAVNGYRRALVLLQGERAAAEQMIARIMDSGFRIRSAEEGPASGGEAALVEAQARLAELEATAGDARRQAAELAEARRQIAALEAARTAAERRVAELESTVQRLSASEASQTEMVRLTGELETARTRIRALEAASGAAERRIAELEAARDTTRDRIAELEEARSAAERRVSELERAREAAARRLGELETLNRENEDRAVRLERIRSQYLALTSPGTDSGVSRSALIALLETKVLIQRVLISDPVRSEYPQLYDRFEQYLEALVQEQERATQVAVLRDVEVLLDSLLRQESRGAPPAALEPYRAAPASEPFLRVLEKLERLLR
ncbi:MAG: hypothetical protein JW820_19175, partial [Spirochaetales bacterium]|nr:hypothetical protein [Spirochaetales bacterium]